MKVLYYHQYFSTPNGSNGTRSYEFSQELIRNGHEVTMVCLKTDRSYTGLRGQVVKGKRRGLVNGINVIEFDLEYSNSSNFLKRSWVFFQFSFKSLLLAFQVDYDLIFATSTPLTISIPGIAAKLFIGKPFLFEVRDLWPELPKAMGIVRNPVLLFFLSALELVSYKSADSCISLAPGITEGIHSKGISLDKIFFIPNACDLKLFSSSNQEFNKNDDLIKNLNIQSKKKLFFAAFTGAHGLANGLEAVLDAANVLINKGRDDIQILFIGDGRCKK